MGISGVAYIKLLYRCWKPSCWGTTCFTIWFIADVASDVATSANPRWTSLFLANCQCTNFSSASDAVSAIPGFAMNDFRLSSSDFTAGFTPLIKSTSMSTTVELSSLKDLFFTLLGTTSSKAARIFTSYFFMFAGMELGPISPVTPFCSMSSSAYLYAHSANRP